MRILFTTALLLYLAVPALGDGTVLTKTFESPALGVEKDLSRSYDWLVIAGANSTGKQAKVVDAFAARLGSKMSPVELARAHTIFTQLNEVISDDSAHGLLASQLVTE